MSELRRKAELALSWFLGGTFTAAMYTLVKEHPDGLALAGYVILAALCVLGYVIMWWPNRIPKKDERG